MKKHFTTLFLVLSVFLTQSALADGLETFANFPETSNAYKDGSFAGQDGSTWTYFQCRGDIHINPPTPTLGKGRTPTAAVESGSISGGIGILSFDFMQAFSTNVNLDVMVNGIVITTVTTNGEVNIVKNSGPITVNYPGSFTIKFIQNNNNAGQVSIDNITWTGYSGSALPEPTNYPTNLAAVAGAFSITLTWQDATAGAQLPQAYLIKASTQNNIQAPVDGTPVADDLDLSDGTGAKNVNQGIQSYTFYGLDNNKPYYFKIYPYTNTGSLIDFKTDGTAPSAQATTPNLVLIHGQDFNDLSFGNWTTVSVLGDEVWTIEPTYGIGSTGCAKMSGYSGSSKANEDWLISPALNLAAYNNEILQFYTAKNYTGEDLRVYISNNYTGSGNPNTAAWTELQYTLSPGGWAWTFSGSLDISGFGTGNAHIAFKYTSTDTESSTWEVDDIKIFGEMGTGINPAPRKQARVYPNPAQNQVYVNLTAQATVTLFSITGEKLFETQMTAGENMVDISSRASGIYFLRIATAGQTVETHKVIIR